ncbi:hypothetical protein NITMOv2_2942 [Nitrospira moscoviensis]|uniref:Uncharacterized protein n=1 Tax=Nitrospira moscoviensis TaxID=42253 RepID=A0A0K2GFG8_NITMO|nr:hypothetical protein NITMOv2_2942 [Nitrospira moscoviensis]
MLFVATLLPLTPALFDHLAIDIGSFRQEHMKAPRRCPHLKPTNPRVLSSVIHCSE